MNCEPLTFSPPRPLQKPAFVFDGRNILDHRRLREIGFEVYAIGKPIRGEIASATPRY